MLQRTASAIQACTPWLPKAFYNTLSAQVLPILSLAWQNTLSLHGDAASSAPNACSWHPAKAAHVLSDAARLHHSLCTNGDVASSTSLLGSSIRAAAGSTGTPCMATWHQRFTKILCTVWFAAAEGRYASMQGATGRAHHEDCCQEAGKDSRYDAGRLGGRGGSLTGAGSL